MRTLSLRNVALCAIVATSGLFAAPARAAVMSGGQPDASEPALQLWLKADALSLTQGAAVGPWTASDGSNAPVYTGSPTYITGANSVGFNHQPVVHLDGVDDTFQILGVTNAVTVIVVAKFNDPTPANRQALFSGNPFSLQGPWDYAGITPADSESGNSYWAYSNPFDQFSTNAYDTNRHITLHEVNSGSNTYRVYSDGSLVLNTTPFAGASLEIAALGFTTVNFYANADIAEVLIYDRLLDSTEKADLQTYLEGKYVPEPASLGLLTAGGLLLLRRRAGRCC
jgi:hypothetical protein